MCLEAPASLSRGWDDLAPLPTVSPWRRGQRTPTWEALRDTYAALPLEPLRLVAVLCSPVIPPEPLAIHLDSPLSWAQVQDFPAPSIPTEAQEPAPVSVIPLPIGLQWVSETGQPLWLCTPLRPVGPTYQGRLYRHKRYPVEQAPWGHKINADMTAGPYRARRTPYRTLLASTLEAFCLGHAALLQALLQHLTHLGKFCAGRVAQWHVEPCAITPVEILSQRNVPLEAYAQLGSYAGQYAPRCGWTPPYWYAPWWLDCMVPV